MCGIVGVFSTGTGWRPSEAELCAMRDQMVHRGPDDAGVFMDHNERFFLGFGHRRLSIIDLSPRGHQPMSTADGTLSIVFNGEIFNYRELRAELVAAGGHDFRSDSDTEVLLYGVRQWGLEGCLRRIRGMYAFALFDRLDRSLTLVRDPLGVKPLYYSHVEHDLFAFASEIKAILAMPGFERKLNRQSLLHYLTIANAPAPETFFEGVRKLEAGCCLKLDSEGRCEVRRYWNPVDFRPHGTPLREEEYIEEIRRLLRQAVSRRVVSDVPFGVFLSGGVDSTLNVALMAELLDRPVETFSIGIEGDPGNEFGFARSVAERFGANHHEMVINDDDFLSFLPKMSYYQDEPLADPVCVPLFHISRLAREAGTPVIQVGEGSDEIFGGYSMYHYFARIEKNLVRYFERLPRSLKTIAHHAGRGMLSVEMEDALRRAAVGEPFFLGNAIAFWDAEKPKLLSGPFSGKTAGSFIGGLRNGSGKEDPLWNIIQVELKNRLPELLLMRVDKMSMAHSIETRVPFLDEDLVAFALQIPSGMKRKNGEPKYILKKAAEGIIPREIIYRKKLGFCGSATNILSARIKGFARDVVLASPFMAETFRREAVERLFERHEKHKRFNSFKIWNLMNLALWHECWFGLR